MSRLWAKIRGLFSNRTFEGIDKAGNRYFARTEEIDSIMKEKRWVVFKGEDDPTSVMLDNCININTKKKTLFSLVNPFNVSVKEKRWVVFKGEDDPTSVPVEWICWLNGQRKRAPTPEEMAEMEARRERVRLNVALLKKEEEERRAKAGSSHKSTIIGKVGGPDLKSFIQQFPVASKDVKSEDSSEAAGGMRSSQEMEMQEKAPDQAEQEPESSEPTGSGASFRPGTWQPPS